MIDRDLWEIGYKKGRAGGGGFAKPPKQTQLMGLGAGVLAALGLLALGIGIKRRKRSA